MSSGFHELHLSLKSFRAGPCAARGRFLGPTPGPNLLQPFGELKRQQLSKQAANADAGQKISSSPNRVLMSIIVSINGTIQRQFHEAGEVDWTAPADLLSDYFSKLFQLLAVWCGFS